jgi:hypothetical protein
MAEDPAQEEALNEPVEAEENDPVLPDAQDETLEQEPLDDTAQVDSEEGDQEELTADELDELRSNEVAFRWEASEYVHNHKTSSWYFGLGVLMIVLIGLAILLHYWLEIIAFPLMGVAIVVYARRPPRTLMYELTPNGITIDGREMPFTEFRSFGVLSDVEWHTIDLEPAKRFSPRLAIIFDTDDFEAIVGHLELHLPRVDRDPDVVERLSRLIRF